MHDFSITLRLDTPLLQSGVASGQVDPSHVLRGPSVRGLLHTWARALFGPFLGGDVELTRRAECLLLGSPAGTEGGPTFRLAVQSKPWCVQKYENSPKSSESTREFRGKRGGHKEGDLVTCEVFFQPRAVALKGPAGALFVKTLAAVAWLSFSLGAIGNRSRRGYGSLTVTGLSPVSSQHQDNNSLDGVVGPWPVFSELPADASSLARSLAVGIQNARDVAQKWLAVSSFSGASTLGALPAMEFDFFQLRTKGQVFVGKEFQNWKVGMQELMESCHNEKGAALYGETMGSSDPRIASPLWVRFYRSTHGCIPVITWSPRPLSSYFASVIEKKRYVHVAAVVNSLTGVARPSSVSALARSLP